MILNTINLINSIPFFHISSISPFEKLYGYAPDYSFFRVFGCTCFILHPRIEHSKLSIDMLFMSFLVIVKVRSINVLIRLLKKFISLVMLFFLNINLSFLFHLLLMID